jgi:hypothetical protein
MFVRFGATDFGARLLAAALVIETALMPFAR